MLTIQKITEASIGTQIISGLPTANAPTTAMPMQIAVAIAMIVMMS